MGIDRIAKAVTACIIAALAALQTALLDGDVTITEWIIVASAFFTALGLTYLVPNRPSDSEIEALVRSRARAE